MPKTPIAVWMVLTAGLCLAWPSAAEAQPTWEPQRTHRPRLGFDGRDPAHTQRVIDRIERGEQPWKRGYETLRDLVDVGVVVPHGSHNWRGQSDRWRALYDQEAANGRVAQAKAAVAWLYSQGLNPTWRPIPSSDPDGWARAQASQAGAIVEGMYNHWLPQQGVRVLQAGDAMAATLTAHCEAYDLLAALPATLRPQSDRMRTAEVRIADLAADVSWWFFSIDGRYDHHHLRIAAALGTAAITVNDLQYYRGGNPTTWSYRPRKWMERAEKAMHPIGPKSALRFQMATGAYAEGSGHYRYAADRLLPFMFAYASFLSGGGVPYLQSGIVNEAALWACDLQLPDGRQAAVDNATYATDPSSGYLLSRVTAGARSPADQAALLWSYERAGFPGFDGPHAYGLLAAYDPAPSIVQLAAGLAGPRPQPSRFMTAQGQAVLRSGWAPGDAFCLVSAEHGEARKHGQRFEAVDNGHHQYFNHGDLITISPGHAGLARAEEVNGPVHHSLVLVGGKGPKPPARPLGVAHWAARGDDATIIAGSRTRAGGVASGGVSGLASTVQVDSRYRSADLRRTLALLGDRYLLIEDSCRSRLPGRRRFSSLVHVNAGAAKARPLQRTPYGFRFETNRGRVPVCVGGASNQSLTVSSVSAFDSNGEGPAGHDVVRFDARGHKVTFLVAVASNAPGGAAPDVRSIPASGAAVLRIEAGGRVDIAISNPRGRRISIAATQGTAAIDTDLDLVVVSFASPTSHRVDVRVGGGTLQVR
ncbi:MAG: hypothetical protein ACYS22_14410 [Planctomycetota bacterium]|jgi:hypothetical protein